MKHKVLFNTANNRLVITTTDEKPDGFIELMNAESPTYNISTQLLACKMFCIGYIMACNTDLKATNDINEFKYI